MKNKKSAGLICSFVFLAAVCMNCKDDITDTGPIDIVFPDSNVAYGRYVQPLFDRGCAFTGCHVGDDAPFGLQLDSYQNALSSDLGVIIPGDTANSRILWRVEGTHNVAIRMPPAPRSPLTLNQIRGLRRWIHEGAQNN
jgi:hypothetical protein